MKYTFLMPAYKATFLREAIQSILNQTYNDFQLIISDDCSPEGLKTIVDEFDDERIVYRRNENNIGAERLVDHWNLLLNMCDSEWCIMAADDDEYDTRFLEELDKLQISHPKVDILRARLCTIDEDGDTTFEEGLFKEYTDQLSFYKQFHYNSFRMSIGNYAFRSSILKENGGFINFPFAWFSDNATVLMAAKNGCVNSTVILFRFRWSGISISSRKPTKHELKYKSISMYEYDKWFKTNINILEGNSKTKLEINDVLFCKGFHHIDIVKFKDFLLYNCSIRDFIYLVNIYEVKLKTKYRMYIKYLLKHII